MHPISTTDPNLGKLYFRGFDVAQLALNQSFEDVCFLLVHGFFPDSKQARSIKEKMRLFRTSKPFKKKLEINEITTAHTPLEILAEQLDEITNHNNLSQLDELLLFVSLAPIVVAMSYRLKHELPTFESHESLCHASDFLWMLQGKTPNPEDAQDFETSLILQMDYPTNTSLSVLENAITSGQSISNSLLSALREFRHPHHHGASEYVLKMLEEIDDIQSVKSYLTNLLEHGNRIFGLGHIEYKTIDPRAVVLRDLLSKKNSSKEDDLLFELAEEVASIGPSLIHSSKGRRVFPNIDLYSSVFFSSIGIPAELFTDIFGIARAAGWMAHAWEIIDSKPT